MSIILSNEVMNTNPFILFFAFTWLGFSISFGTLTAKTMFFENQNGDSKYTVCEDIDYSKQGSDCVGKDAVYMDTTKRINNHLYTSIPIGLLTGGWIYLSAKSRKKEN